MKNYVQDGNVIEFANGASAVTGGQVVTIGGLIGVAAGDIAANAKGSVHLSGVFTLPKLAANNFVPGTKPRWDVSAGNFSTSTIAAAGDISDCCTVLEPAGAGATEVVVLINQAGGVIT